MYLAVDEVVKWESSLVTIVQCMLVLKGLMETDG